jgi:TolB protein
LVAVVAVDARFVSAASPPSNGPIAFVSDRGGDPEIFALDPSDGVIEQLTDNEAWDTDPAWSPDATRLAISSNRDGDDDIYVLDATGTGAATNLTDGGTTRDTQPDWSPGGKRIVFVRDGDVYVVPVAGGTPQRLVRGHDPVWSPDGSSIAFTRSGDILVMDADGSGAHTVLQDADPFGLDWSPDGTSLVFAANGLSDDGGFHIYVMDAEGTGVQQVTGDDIAEDFSPAFSPDGQKIVFTRIGVDADVVVIDRDGTDPVTIVDDPAYDFEPHWAVCSGAACPPEPTESPTTEPSPSASPSGPLEPSTLSLSVVKGPSRVRAAGRLRPAHDGTVAVKLQKRKGRWVTVAIKQAPLGDAGGYRARFRRLRRGAACRIVAKWRGDADHLPSVARDRFSC